jgi:hypothetical protein
MFRNPQRRTLWGFVFGSLPPTVNTIGPIVCATNRFSSAALAA